jgi:hypothetical protein
LEDIDPESMPNKYYLHQNNSRVTFYPGKIIRIESHNKVRESLNGKIAKKYNLTIETLDGKMTKSLCMQSGDKITPFDDHNEHSFRIMNLTKKN